MDEQELPQRKPGTHAPRSVLQVANDWDERWHVPEETLELILNNLRQWQVTGPVTK